MRTISKVAGIAAATASFLTLSGLLFGVGQQAAAAPNVHYYYNMVVVTGGMLGTPGEPKFMPADFKLPTNAEVTVTITSFDDGAAPVPAVYAKVTGTLGGTEVVNGRKVKAIAAKDVSHTFTVSGLKLNVPIPVAASKTHPAVVTFTFHTPKGGHYVWQCYAPCGSGASGWSGPMATNGYMRGVVTFTNN